MKDAPLKLSAGLVGQISQLSGIERLLSLAVVTAYKTSGREGLCQSVWLQGLSDHSELFTSSVLRDSLLSNFLSLKKLPSKMKCSNSEGIAK